MSTKFSYWLSNKDKSSKKSAGCMTGIFQLFNRQFLLTSPQLSGQYHKKSSSADETICLCKLGADYREFCNLEQNLSRSYQENSRSSMESSTRTSFSSSSTSCSSLKNRLPKEESKSSEQSFSSVRSPKNSTKPTKTDINQSPGFRECIKESLYKDLKNVSIKEKTKEAVKRNKVLKPVDSPRPIDLSKMKELEESIEILIKLRDLPRNFNEARVSPRFSFDGRISTDIKQAIAQKEHRRLSLDSMKDSLTLDLLSKVNSLVKELEMKTNSSKSKASNLQQDLRSNENQTNIVAKLMGLGPINSARESYFKDHEPINNQKIRISISPHLKPNSDSRLAVEETQQKIAVESVDGNMKQKIESVYSVVEKTLQKLEIRYNSKEIRDLKRAILKTKISAKILSPTRKTEKSSISERAFNADGGRTPTGMAAKSLNSSAKEKGRREGEISVSPRLQKRGNHDQEKKSSTVNPPHGLKKNQKQPDNMQQSESVSPSSRIRQKSRQAQLNEGNPFLLQQPKGKTVTIAASASNYKQHQMLLRKVVFLEELEKIVPQLSSPNSVLNGSSYQDDPPLSPLSVSSTSNEEENPPSDHNFKTIHLPQNLPSTLSFEKDAQKLENTDTEVHKFIFQGSTTDNKIDPDNKYVAEVLLSSGLLPKDSHLPAILKQMNLVDPSEAAEKNNAQMLHKQLVRDVVNEILSKKTEAFNSCCQHDHLRKPNMLSLHLFEELCLEVRYLQSSIDRSFEGEDTVFTKDLLRRSNAWDRFDSEVPVVVLEIERLIFVDLIDEIAGSLDDVVVEPKQRYRRKLLM